MHVRHRLHEQRVVSEMVTAFNVYRSSSDPVLLIPDGHGSHVKAIDALNFAEKHNITIICLPPHTTHRTQPLDVSFFKPLKSHYAQCCRRFMRLHPGKAIMRNNFPQLFTKAYTKTASMEIAVNSFRCTGIYIRLMTTSFQTVFLHHLLQLTDQLFQASLKIR